jgi:general secretion pathway protein K
MFRQRGIAAITAILVVALASILAVELAWELNLDIRRTENMLLRDQARQIALGAELMAADELRKDYEKDAENDLFCDDLTERWNTDLTFPVDGGAVRGKLSGMQGRFNLNNLIDAANKEDDPETFNQFKRLLTALELDTEIAPKVLDWIDPNQIAEFGGAEDGVYTAKSPPYLTANTWFTTTTELLAIDGFVDPAEPDPSIFKLLERYVAALPSGTKINVNTAEDPVLASFAESASLATAERLRANRPYCQLWDEPNAAGASGVSFWDDAKDIIGDENQAFVTENLEIATEYFQLKVAVTLGTTQLTMYSLMHRDPVQGLVTTRLRYFDTK